MRGVEGRRVGARGQANKQIGRARGSSGRRVKVHVSHVVRRIGVTDRTSAAMWARENLEAEESA